LEIILANVFAGKNLFQDDWKYKCVHTSIVLLTLSEWPTIPVRNLLFFAYFLLSNPFADGRKAISTTFFEVWVELLIYDLDINKVRNVFDESHMWEEFRELANVA
jgi:hypothetical protein